MGWRDEFDERGIVRLTGVFGADEAALMRDAVWRDWRVRYGAVPDDRSTWPPGEWATHLRAKRDPVFRRILGPALGEVARALLGRWTASTGFGNLLVSFPDAETWRLPARSGQWHSDFGYHDDMDPLPALRVFAVFGDVPPGGGGTLLVAGSHRMIARFVTDRPELRAAPAKESGPVLQRSNLWLEELTRGDDDAPGRVERFMSCVTDVDGIPAQVLEACGEPGDVYVCHPWTLHCRPPNASDRPRFLRSPTLTRTE